MEENKKSPETLAELFDTVYEDFQNFASGNVTDGKEERLAAAIASLEEMSNKVSSLDMFSKNEHYKEMNPKYIKFLMLPYMLGVLWQLSKKESRKVLCHRSLVYFEDFVGRCLQYEIVQEIPRVRDSRREGGENSVPKKTENSDERRKRKIEKYKENQLLDVAIQEAKEYLAKGGDDADDAMKDLYLNQVRRAINDTQDQIESIETELDLIAYSDGRDGTEGPATDSGEVRDRRPKMKPFIITKDAVQKAVYGMGYPSLPVMTVEELYEQRRATGEWGPPAAPGQERNPEQEAEAEAARNEVLQEQDDEAEIARRRGFDEYKDDHRRGWGNRFNRS